MQPITAIIRSVLPFIRLPILPRSPVAVSSADWRTTQVFRTMTSADSISSVESNPILVKPLDKRSESDVFI